VAFLGLDVQDEAVQAVLERYRPEAARAQQKGIHLTKAGRSLPREAHPKQQQVLQRSLGRI